MKGFLASVIVFFVIVHLDSVSSLPKIKPDPRQETQPTIYGDWYSYEAAPEVRLICEDAEEWDQLEILTGNPVDRQAEVKNSQSVDDKPKIGITIEYDVTHFVKLLKVTCRNGNDTDVIMVEQLYPTTNVKILSVNNSVEAGETVRLRCLADGNTEPEYQWYKKNKNGTFEELENGNKATVDITTPKAVNATNLYQCRARNTFNDTSRWVNSTSGVVVKATSLPFPIIEFSGSLSNESTADKFVYFQNTKVTLRCSLPVPLPEDTELKISHRVDVKNPIFVDERVYESGVAKGKDSITVILLTNPGVYIPQITIWCDAKKKKTFITKITSKVTLEQKFATQATQIEGPTSRTVEPGKEAVLQCLADGNPPPQYQWFTWRKNFTEWEPIDGATESAYKFMMPMNETKRGYYKCGAKNEYNDDFVMNPNGYEYKVSTYVPSPIIELLTPHYNETSGRFVYMETHNISLRCTLPPPVLYDLILEVWYAPKHYLNPFFSTNGFTVNSTGDPHDNITVVTPYNDGLLAPLMDVTCYSQHGPGWFASTETQTTIRIEQQFKTANVAVLLDPPTRVAAGDIVELECLADGYPLPQEFQWYKLSNNGSKIPLNCSTRSCTFKTPEGDSTEEKYVCETKNKYNNETVESRRPRKVVATFIPFPTMDPISMPSENTSSKFIYEAIDNVTVQCSLPAGTSENVTMDVQVTQLKPYNPIFPDARIETNSTMVDEHNLTVWIAYDREQFVPLVNVNCTARLPTGQFRSTVHQIEQHYNTSNVTIIGGQTKKVEAGDLVELVCLSDGYPTLQYQWFIRSESGDKVLLHTSSTYWFTTATSQSTTEQYMCGAKTQQQFDFVKSEPTTVISTYIPYPVFETITPTLNTTNEKFTYLNKSHVTLQCYLPLPVPDDVHLVAEKLYPYHDVKLTMSGKNHNLTLELDIETSEYMVMCTAGGNNYKTKRSSNLEIVVEYKTTYAKIDCPNSFDPGLVIVLYCTADGYPKPAYQWFSHSTTGDNPIPNATSNFYLLPIPMDEPFSEQYVCGARNYHNNEFVKSQPFAVLSPVTSVAATEPSTTITAPDTTVSTTPSSASVHYSTWLLTLAALILVSRTM